MDKAEIETVVAGVLDFLAGGPCPVCGVAAIDSLALAEAIDCGFRPASVCAGCFRCPPGTPLLIERSSVA